jgi:LytS/YehU family sensor histidine kinase
MEKRNLQTGLNLLKAQLHPHFLFNTLNNLYALSLEQSSKTSEGIAKISALLGAVLYECYR